ncbi:hypothetical protein CHUAL_003699 [Chamberlinius hualienensis]
MKLNVRRDEEACQSYPMAQVYLMIHLFNLTNKHQVLTQPIDKVYKEDSNDAEELHLRAASRRLKSLRKDFAETHKKMLSLANSTMKIAASALSIQSESWWPSRERKTSVTLKIAASGLTIQSETWWPSPERKTSVTTSSLRPFREYSLEEVSWHWEAHDCWIVMYDKVYDVTDFLKEHPGGYEVLLEHAGRDATVAFRGSNHSKAAVNSMEQYLIGVLIPSERMYQDVDSNL